MIVNVDVSFFGHPTLHGLRVETCYVITENGAEPLCPAFEQELFNYVENELNPYIGELEVLKYTSVTQGDDYPVADFACEECGKLGVSISESFLPIGQCCFCGYENDVRVCELCNSVYDSDGGDEHLCNACLPKDDD